MGRPRGSRNKPKHAPIGNPIPGGANEPSQPDPTPAPDALAAPATLAPGDATEGGETPAPAVGDTATHPDGRSGTITEVEPRGSGHAVSVRWAGDEDDSKYTPTDWQEMQAAPVAAPAHAPEPTEEPKPETAYDDTGAPQPPPGLGLRLAEIGHEWADTDRQLIEKEAEKSTVVKSYTKAIDILDARCRQLAADYREAEWPETYDYKRGLKHVWNGRTGRLVRTEELGSYQVPLDLDHPVTPPVAEAVAAIATLDAEVTMAVVDGAETEPDAAEPTPFDDVTEDAAE